MGSQGARPPRHWTVMLKIHRIQSVSASAPKQLSCGVPAHSGCVTNHSSGGITGRASGSLCSVTTVGRRNTYVQY